MKEIYAYRNTTSQAGKAEYFNIDVNNIDSIKCWFNYYGNPSYVFHMTNGDTYLLVDDYGAMNGIKHLSRKVVNRKKDMFIKW